ncbi:mannosyl-oligosaccharide alpha-1,2-mannosidase [Ascosphaera aggregata]|nr:mannosyl-oligosaccharide alpha-1,2-mannosidase [Ascosphaera aggregata]
MALSLNPQRRKRQIVFRTALVLCCIFIWRWFFSSSNDGKSQEREKTSKKVLARDRMYIFVDNPDVDVISDDTEQTKIDKEKNKKNEKVIDWADRRERVRDAFLVSWEAYAQDAWGHDIYHPRTRRGEDMIEDGMGWIIVDALDTMMMMNLSTPVQYARNWIRTSPRKQVFESVVPALEKYPRYKFPTL